MYILQGPWVKPVGDAISRETIALESENNTSKLQRAHLRHLNFTW